MLISLSCLSTYDIVRSLIALAPGACSLLVFEPVAKATTTQMDPAHHMILTINGAHSQPAIHTYSYTLCTARDRLLSAVNLDLVTV